MKRKQFTFYYSFYDVISCMESPVEQAEAYSALCRYALIGEKPDFDGMSLGARMAVKAFMPTLDAARRKATGGARGGSMRQGYRKDNGRIVEGYDKDNERIAEGYDKDNESKKKDKIKDKDKIEIKIEDKHKCEAAFDRFWEVYPRKVKKQEAWRAFLKVDVSLDVLLQALEKQKKNPQWLEDGGRFVPYPASWLNERRWEDEVTAFDTTGGVPMGRAEMRDTEFGDMARAMRNAE